MTQVFTVEVSGLTISMASSEVRTVESRACTFPEDLTTACHLQCVCVYM